MLSTAFRAFLCVVAATAAALVGGFFSPAAACDVNGNNCGGDGPDVSGRTIAVTVTHSYGSGGSSGSAGTSTGSTTVQVPVPCWYVQGKTGKEYYHWVESGQASIDWYHHGGGDGPFEPYPGYKQHKNDSEGHWYGSACSSETFENIDDFFEYSQQWFAEHPSVYVPGGGQPPIPPIPPEVLLEAATDALTIPEPEFVWSPQLVDGQGTLVNLDTWFWLDDYPTEGTVTASAGPSTVTVDLTLDDVQYSSAEAGSVTCADGGSPWQEGASSDCRLVFPRASDATTVAANAAWSGTWSYNGVPQGAIDPVSADWETSFPVREAGAVVTDVD